MSTAIYHTTYFQMSQGADALDFGIDLLSLIMPIVVVPVFSGILISKTGHTKIFGIVSSAFMPVEYRLFLLKGNSNVGERIVLLIVTGMKLGFINQLYLTYNWQRPRNRAKY